MPRTPADARYNPQPGDTMTHLPSGGVCTVVRVEDATVYYLDPDEHPDRVHDMDLEVWAADPMGLGDWAWAAA